MVQEVSWFDLASALMAAALVGEGKLAVVPGKESKTLGDVN